MPGSSRIRPIQVLEKVVRIANSRVVTEKKLQNILQTVSRELGLGQGFIFRLDRKHQVLHLHFAGDRTEDWMYSHRYAVGEGLIGEACLRRIILRGTVEAPDRSGRRSGDARRVLVFPLADDAFLYGAAVYYIPGAFALTESRLDLVKTVCLELAGVMRNSRMALEGKLRTMELNALMEVGKTISANMELEPLARDLVALCARLVSARNARLTVWDTEGEQELVGASFGVPLDFRSIPMQVELDLGEGFVGSLSVSEKIRPDDGHTVPFNGEDARLLQTVSSFVSSAMQKSLMLGRVESLARRNEEMVGILRALHEISGAMITTVDFEEILNIFVNAAIFGEGLQFDRVFVLLLDEKKQVLRLHRKFFRQESSPWDPAAMGGFSNPSHPRMFEDLVIPFRPDAGAVVRCLVERRPLQILNPRDPEWTPSDRLGALLCHPYVAVPLSAKEGFIGVVVADHALKDRGVYESELKALTMLVNQTGLALENSRLVEFIDGVNRELKLAKERLIESEKLAAVGELTAGIAHEIRNPLVSIGGFARRVYNKVEEESPLKGYLGVIVSEVARLEKILHDVLDFSSDTTGGFKYFDLNEVILEALHFVRLELQESGISVEKRLNLVPRLLGDARQIRHLYYNLFLNAVQAMKQGGVIYVEAVPMTDCGRPLIVTVVRDMGGGIPPEILHNIFNPFFTTKAQGSGLGLAMVHKIVTRHRGEIEVHNDPGKGVSFTIRFPVYPQDTPE